MGSSNEAALPACCGWIWPQIHAKESRGWSRNGCRYRSSSGSPPWPGRSTPASRRGSRNSAPGCSSPAVAAPSPVGCAACGTGCDYKRYYYLLGSVGRKTPAIARALLRILLKRLPGDGAGTPLVFAIDDSPTKGLSQEGGFPGGSLWTISLEMCSIVGELTPISIDGGSPMSTITQRIASAFVVLCGRYGDVTKMAHDREQSRQSLYREASQVANAVDGTAVQSRIDELQRQLAGQQAQIQDLQERLEHAIEITRDKQDEFASVAQAEGVSLSVARRLLQVVAGSVTTPSVPTLGRATEEAGQLRRPVARSDQRGGPTQGQTGHRRRNFFGPKPVLMLVEPGSLCWVGGRMVEARDGPTWAVEFARFSRSAASSGTMAAAWARG